MPRLIAAPTVIEAAGNMPKRIEEYAGRVNSGHGEVSVARMVSPQGREEPTRVPSPAARSISRSAFRRSRLRRCIAMSSRL